MRFPHVIGRHCSGIGVCATECAEHVWTAWSTLKNTHPQTLSGSFSLVFRFSSPGARRRDGGERLRRARSRRRRAGALVRRVLVMNAPRPRGHDDRRSDDRREPPDRERDHHLAPDYRARMAGPGPGLGSVPGPRMADSTSMRWPAIDEAAREHRGAYPDGSRDGSRRAEPSRRFEPLPPRRDEPPVRRDDGPPPRRDDGPRREDGPSPRHADAPRRDEMAHGPPQPPRRSEPPPRHGDGGPRRFDAATSHQRGHDESAGWPGAPRMPPRGGGPGGPGPGPGPGPSGGGGGGVPPIARTAAPGCSNGRLDEGGREGGRGKATPPGRAEQGAWRPTAERNVGRGPPRAAQSPPQAPPNAMLTLTLTLLLTLTLAQP